MKDACARKAMQTYEKWSARAAQATAKCRKAHGAVRKTQAGANLKRWEKEKWKDKISGKPCGSSPNSTEYCRPTQKVSAKTPVMPRGKRLQKAIRSKLTLSRATTLHKK